MYLKKQVLPGECTAFILDNLYPGSILQSLKQFLKQNIKSNQKILVLKKVQIDNDYMNSSHHNYIAYIDLVNSDYL